MNDNTNMIPLPAKRSLLVSMASKYGMDAETFKNVIKATVMPGNATNEQMAAFLMVANAYDLNPVTKEIYAFPAQGGGVTSVVGVDGWLRLANRHPQYDGCEFENQEDEKGTLVSCTCIVYRKDRGHATKVTEYMSECARKTAPWASHPRRMLRNKALIQGIRYALGFAGIHDEDDADVIRGDYSVVSSAATLRQIQGASSEPQEPSQAQSAATTQTAIREPASEQQEPAQGPASADWPKEYRGANYDARGIIWDGTVHTGAKTCNSDGTWRRRKGVLPETLAAAEARYPRIDPLTAFGSGPEIQSGPDPLELEPSTGPSFADVLRWVESAQTTTELDEAMDAGKDVDMGASQRVEIIHAAATQAAIIERMKQT